MKLEAPRWRDPAWWAAYRDDLRPRLLWLRLDVRIEIVPW